MTQPEQPQSLADAVPAQQPAQFTTGVVVTGDGRKVLVRLVVPGACVTALVDPDDAARWAAQFEQAVIQARTGLLVSAPGVLNGSPR